MSRSAAGSIMVTMIGFAWAAAVNVANIFLFVLFFSNIGFFNGDMVVRGRIVTGCCLWRYGGEVWGEFVLDVAINRGHSRFV